MIRRKRDYSMHPVVETDLFFQRAQANHKRFAFIGESLCGCFREGAACALIPRGLTPAQCIGTSLFQLISGTEASICLPFGQEPVHILAVEPDPLRLPKGTLIPVEAKPSEVLHNGIFEEGFRTLHVCVFYAYDEFARL